MANTFIKNSSGRVLLLGSILWAVVFILLFLLMNAPQCPEGYTEEQIQASDCIVGANIGIGLLIVCAPMLWAVCVYVTAASLGKNSGKTKDN